MDSVDVRIGERLREAREMLGLTQSDVSERVGFNSYQILSNIEKGIRAVKVAELSRLSKVYCKDLQYFLATEEAQAECATFAWRARSESNHEPEVKARAHQMLEHYALVQKIMGQPCESSIEPWEGGGSSLTWNEVRSHAEKFADKHNLGPWPSRVLPKVMVDQLGIKLLLWDLKSAGSAVTAQGTFGSGIVINSSEVPWRRSFSLAHELFHLLSINYYPLQSIHSSLPTVKPMEEKLADWFASTLLMPEKSFKAKVAEYAEDNKISWTNLAQLARDFGVSREACIWRMKSLKYFSELTAEHLVNSPEFKKIDQDLRTGDPKDTLPFSESMVFLALEAYNQGRISKGKFCQIFDITRGELAEFLRKRGASDDLMEEEDIMLDHT